jgi:hypothetical protein
MDTNFKKILNSSIEEGNKKVEVYKKENEKIVTNLDYKINNFEKKIDKLKK